MATKTRGLTASVCATRNSITRIVTVATGEIGGRQVTVGQTGGL